MLSTVYNVPFPNPDDDENDLDQRPRYSAIG